MTASRRDAIIRTAVTVAKISKGTRFANKVLLFLAVYLVLFTVAETVVFCATGQEQTELVTEFCKARAEKGVTIFTDPIMGDEGKLYNGITEETIDLMRELISAADYI